MSCVRTSLLLCLNLFRHVHVGRPIGTSEDIEDIKIIVVNDIRSQDNDVSVCFNFSHSYSKLNPIPNQKMI